MSPSGARVWSRVALDEPEELELSAGRAVVYTHTSPTKDVNEDAAAFVPTGPSTAVLVVADGMGGQALGERASAIAVERIVAAVERSASEGGRLREAVLDGVEAAQRDVRALGVGAGTTLAVALLADGRVRALHAGDSAVLVVGQRGRVKVQTKMHSPTGYAFEAGLLDERELLVHEDRHVISNFVGSSEMHVEMSGVRPLAARDTVLLASDGLLDNLTVDEIVERVRKGPLAGAARALRDDARARMATERGKPDDLTFVLYRPS